jgi:hypothetical protein
MINYIISMLLINYSYSVHLLNIFSLHVILILNCFSLEEFSNIHQTFLMDHLILVDLVELELDFLLLKMVFVKVVGLLVEH